MHLIEKHCKSGEKMIPLIPNSVHSCGTSVDSVHITQVASLSCFRKRYLMMLISDKGSWNPISLKKTAHSEWLLHFGSVPST
jgi:hypothetical protein